MYFYRMKRCIVIFLVMVLNLTPGSAKDSVAFRQIADQILLQGQCYEDLRVLCKTIGHRLSGSPQASRAVEWGEKTLREAGADKVWLQKVDVPYWVRGKENLKIRIGKEWKHIPMLSLGNTVGTDGKILEAPVVLIQDFDELQKLSRKEIAGKIVFFNHRFPQHLPNPFDGYGAAGAYRWNGPNLAAAKGAAAVIIRSVSTGLDDVPHTGSLRYADTIQPIPAIAIGNTTADLLENECKKNIVTAQLQSDCRMAGTTTSFNVIGELTGSEYPDHIVLAGGHLDSWDVGEGAHDDGAGCVQSIEILRTFKRLNIQPKRTLRIVLFMNEENGLKGGLAYADSAKAKKEKHILALESDAGGFSPRGIGLDMEPAQKKYLQKFRHLFLPYGVYDFEQTHGGADISPLKKAGVPVAGLIPDPQRYFDYHHTDRDVFEAVNHRELKLGAVAMAQFIWLITEYGL